MVPRSRLRLGRVRAKLTKKFPAAISPAPITRSLGISFGTAGAGGGNFRSASLNNPGHSKSIESPAVWAPVGEASGSLMARILRVARAERKPRRHRGFRHAPQQSFSGRFPGAGLLPGRGVPGDLLLDRAEQGIALGVEHLDAHVVAEF